MFSYNQQTPLYDMDYLQYLNNSNLFNNIGLGVDAFNKVGNLWLGFQNYNMAKKSFSFNKNIMKANYTNSAKAYNYNLENDIRRRFAQLGKSNSAVNAYMQTAEFKRKLAKESL